MSDRVPIRNLYYLLCYAWDKLEARGLASVFVDGQRDVTNLLARIIVGAASYVVRRGMDRAYVSRVELLPVVRGRIDVAGTLARARAGRVLCTYDDLDADVLHNRIMRATLLRIAHVRQVAAANRNEAIALLQKLHHVRPIDLTPSVFRRVRLNRNNAYYSVLMDACELFFTSSLPCPDGEGYRIEEFSGAPRDMANLFERFVANFYAREQERFRVKPQRLRWTGLRGSDEDLRYLPQMRTDILLHSARHAIVIDCKYYDDAFRRAPTREYIRTEHLYQITAYATNIRAELEPGAHVDAILLYPVVTRARALDFTSDSFDVKVRFINLNQDWRLIHRDLLRIAGIYETDLAESIGSRLALRT